MIDPRPRRYLAGALLILLAAALPAAVLSAYAGDAPPTPRGGRIIEAFLIWRLVDELDLNEGQIARIFPRIRALKTIRLESGRRVPPLMREIRQLMAASPRDEEAIRGRVAELNALRAQIEARRRRELELIAQALTVEQLAKFALIQETFEAETLRLLEDMRRIAGERSGPRP
jgi:Spy/CpxP family protein refolding chaperone